MAETFIGCELVGKMGYQAQIKWHWRLTFINDRLISIGLRIKMQRREIIVERKGKEALVIRSVVQVQEHFNILIIIIILP